ncbi:phosphonate transport system substrate-binding protein [Cyclobacterium xiamenense]|uniref:Phosphonate transport system substrate-binding protein n=2 Tax=Cyclobacterium xiamenense TaxID=1297121 RepID=A0A1H6TTU1_9BACT|nr:phosphonate transport system substrate-binding protein [Cyclobacterium xiamenense]
MKGVYIFCVCLVMVSCTDVENSGSQVPQVFRYGYRPPDVDVGEKMAELDGFRQYLEKKLEMPVELYEILGYAPAIEALRANKIEMTTLGSFAFVIAEEKAGIEPIAYRGHKDTGKGSYFSLFITTRKDLKTIEDVKEKAHTLKLAFGNPASTSGHLIPRKYLKENGINPETDFEEVLYCPDHTASLMATLSGNVDVAAVMNITINKFLQSGKITENDFVTLFQSDPIQTDAYVVRPNLPLELKQKAIKAMVDMCQEAPEIWYGISPVSDRDVILFPARQELWNEIREMALLTKKEMFGK